MNREHNSEWADSCPLWLLSVTLNRRKNGLWPEWMMKHITPERKIIFDAGFSEKNRVTFENYLQFIKDNARPQDEYLQYDIIGDPVETAKYLEIMLQRGFKPIPIFQKGGDREILHLPKVAIGGLVRLSEKERISRLDDIFFNKGVGATTETHALGMWRESFFNRYPLNRGDSSEWIRNVVDKRRSNWQTPMSDYGVKDYEYKTKTMIQGCLF